MNIQGAVEIAYRRAVAAADDPVAMKTAIVEHIRAHVGPVQAATGFGVDEIIDPAATERPSDALALAPARHGTGLGRRTRGGSPI